MSPEALNEYPVLFETPVAWGEMDSFSHVNNVIYFKYFESARIAYFERIGFPKWMKQHGVGPILASTQCRFRRALSYPDHLSVGARVTELGTDRFTMKYAVFSHQLKDIAAVGEGLIISYDYRNSVKAPLPDSIRAAIEALG
jgi:acyl-CoA thioester hydrolase